MAEMSEQTLVNEVISRLARKYPMVPATTISSIVRDLHAKFDGRPLREFIPLFVERNARIALTKLTG